MKTILWLATATGTTLLAGCATGAPVLDSSVNDLPAESALSAECDAAAVQAMEEEQLLYDTHPVWDFEIPGPDGSPEAWAEYESLRADEEARWAAAYAPIYSTCASPEEWWAAANKHPRIAGLTSADFLSPEDIVIWCSDSLDQPACTGIDEWLASSPG